jgi:hypothetical protein
MEQELGRDSRLDVARRMYDALCVQYPDRFITLFDQDGLYVAAHSARLRGPAAEDPICTALI